MYFKYLNLKRIPYTCPSDGWTLPNEVILIELLIFNKYRYTVIGVLKVISGYDL